MNMEKKWVCDKCGSINRTAEGKEMVCSICGASGASVAERKPGTTDKTVKDKVRDAVGAGSGAEGIRGGLLRQLKKLLADMAGKPSDASGGKAVDWKVRRSELSSREAYVEATPVRDEARRDSGTSGAKVPDETKEKPARAADGTAAASDVSETWPEHRIRLDMAKIKAGGCIRIEKAELNGTKGYSLKYDGGKERFMAVSTMKMMGYAKDA